MLQPQSFLDHADRLLTAAADDADIRRAISAMYYALFHLLTSSAADRLAAGNPGLAARLRRGAQHRDLRKVCDGMTAPGSAGRASMLALFAEPLSARLVNVAAAFAILQDARHQADYDLDVDPSLAAAETLRELCHEAFDDWAAIAHHSDTTVFLAALLLADRWTRRG